MSVRDPEAAAEASGVSIRRAKLMLWVIAGSLTGLAGALAYMNTLQVTPDALTITAQGTDVDVTALG